MAILPSKIEQRSELDCRLGIKSSLNHISSIVALSYLLYCANNKNNEIVYADEIKLSNGKKKLVLKNSYKQWIMDNYTIDEDSLNNNPLLTSQLEALQVGLGLMFHLANVSFVDFPTTDTKERTGGDRFRKVMNFALNMKLLDLYLMAWPNDLMKNEIISWLNCSPSDTAISKGLKQILTAFSEDTQYKIRANGEEVVFQQIGIYNRISNEVGVIAKDEQEDVGPFRIFKSFVRENLHPFLKLENNEFHCNNNKELNVYKNIVETTLNLSPKKTVIYQEVLDNLNLNSSDPNNTHQIIYYGAPGTGKSNKIEECTNDNNRIRTTFHPDSDYSTFVGAYKPTMEGYDDKIYTKGELINKLTEFKNSGVPYSVHKFAAKYWRSLKNLNILDKKDILASCAISDSYTVELDKSIAIGEEYLKQSKESHISYKYVPQAFLKAYVNSWNLIDKLDNSPYYLIIEEINRGNCAQIFGDLFQLLDRGENGESKYAICPDEDIRRYLAEQFNNATNIPDAIKNGKEMHLPSNLYIWATMNTSDQSLFPIDSAFKRRWDWEYIPIEKGNKDFVIEIGNKKYDWWNFISIINSKIDEITGSEDKKLGYWFAKPAGNSTTIKCDQFVSKVLFYLWNDVYKDYTDDNRSIFRIVDGNSSKKVTFIEFFGAGREEKLYSFMQANGINPISYNSENNQDENFTDDEAGVPSSQRDYSKYSINGNGMYGKGELVRRVIELYCEQLSSSNAIDIRTFWMGLNTGIGQLVETQTEFDSRTMGSIDVNKRAKELKLSNGESIYISTQVGSGNIQTFINAVNSANIGFSIVKI